MRTTLVAAAAFVALCVAVRGTDSHAEDPKTPNAAKSFTLWNHGALLFTRDDKGEAVAHTIPFDDNGKLVFSKNLSDALPKAHREAIKNHFAALDCPAGCPIPINPIEYAVSAGCGGVSCIGTCKPGLTSSQKGKGIQPEVIIEKDLSLDDVLPEHVEWALARCCCRK